MSDGECRAQTEKEFTEVLSKRGGDYADLHGQHIKFITESILTDKVCPLFICLALLIVVLFFYSASHVFCECKWSLWLVSGGS